MFLLRRLFYYLRSIGTLLRGIKDWPTLIAAFVGRPSSIPFLIQLRDSGLRFKVRNAMDVWIVKETCLDRDYERISEPIEDGWAIMDIGAALGDFAVDIAARYPRSVVHAYEPFPESLALLEENIQMNGIDNVTAFGEAIAKEPGTITLELLGEAVQHSTTEQQATDNRAISVPAITLGEAVARLPRGECDLLKMDCEGAEYDILFNADETSLQRIQRIVMEYHNGVTSFSHRDLVLFLEQKGFQVALHPSTVQPHLGLLYAQK